MTWKGNGIAPVVVRQLPGGGARRERLGRKLGLLRWWRGTDLEEEHDEDDLEGNWDCSGGGEALTWRRSTFEDGLSWGNDVVARQRP